MKKKQHLNNDEAIKIIKEHEKGIRVYRYRKLNETKKIYKRLLEEIMFSPPNIHEVLIETIFPEFRTAIENEFGSILELNEDILEDTNSDCENNIFDLIDEGIEKCKDIMSKYEWAALRIKTDSNAHSPLLEGFTDQGINILYRRARIRMLWHK
jgi:hypothetical protein